MVNRSTAAPSFGGQMHVVVTTFGSDGDVNPLLAIAGALVRRGVAVTFVANPFYEARVVRSGSRFLPAGDYLDLFVALEANPAYLHTGRGLVALWNQLIGPSIRDAYPIVANAVRDTGATAVVSHVVSFGGAWAAAQCGVHSVLVSTFLASGEPPVVAADRRPACTPPTAIVPLPPRAKNSGAAAC